MGKGEFNPFLYSSSYENPLQNIKVKTTTELAPGRSISACAVSAVGSVATGE